MSGSNGNKSAEDSSAEVYAKQLIADVTEKARLNINKEQQERLKQTQKHADFLKQKHEIGNLYARGGGTKHTNAMEDEIQEDDPYAHEEGPVDYISPDDQTTVSYMTHSDESELHSVGTYKSESEVSTCFNDNSDPEDDLEKRPENN